MSAWFAERLARVLGPIELAVEDLVVVDGQERLQVELTLLVQLLPLHRCAGRRASRALTELSRDLSRHELAGEGRILKLLLGRPAMAPRDHLLS